MRRHALGLAGFAVVVGACAARLPQAQPCDPASGWRPLCGLQNPEDVIALPEGGRLLASELRRPGDPPGAIVAFTLDGEGTITVVGPSAPAERLEDALLANVAVGCPGPLPADGLEPHGMELVVEGAPPWVLLVVNHGTRESVEVYDVTPGDGPPRLRWIGCVPLPEGFAANDVAALPDGAFMVTAAKARGVDYALAFVRMMLGIPAGDVLAWSAAHGWRHVEGSQAGLPNGIAAAGDRLFVADWSGSRLVRIERSTGRRNELALPHHPDNLSWSADGRLLVAGQLGSVRHAMGCLDAAVRSCGQPWSVLAVDPDTLAVEAIAAGDGREFGAAWAATQVGDVLVVGTWAGDRVLRRRLR
jgi:hypothetical protein